MLRKLVITCLLALVLAVAYAAMPFLTAWQIREAVRSGDRVLLAEKVDWHSVRRSLKSSLDESRQIIREIALAAGEPRPTLWQRLKAAALPYVSDPLIDTYVTAEGATKLYAWRQGLRQRLGRGVASGEAETPLAGTWLAGSRVDRNLALARRVERWAFVTPMRLEIEVGDAQRPGRRWFAAMELRGYGWQLTEMKVLGEAAGLARASSFRVGGARPAPQRQGRD